MYNISYNKPTYDSDDKNSCYLLKYYLRFYKTH